MDSEKLSKLRDELDEATFSVVPLETEISELKAELLQKTLESDDAVAAERKKHTARILELESRVRTLEAEAKANGVRAPSSHAPCPMAHAQYHTQRPGGCVRCSHACQTHANAAVFCT